MRAQYTSRTRPNPLTAPINSRFAVALAAVSDQGISCSREDGHHQSNSPVHQDHGSNPFHSCLSFRLSACKEDLDPKDLRRELRFLRSLRAASQAVA